MSNVFDMTKKELQAFLVAQGMKKFRADQIFHYIYTAVYNFLNK